MRRAERALATDDTLSCGAIGSKASELSDAVRGDATLLEAGE